MFLAFLLAAAVPDGSWQALVQADSRLVAIGRRLARGGAGLCKGAVSNPGWTIEDSEQFPPALRSTVSAALRLGEYPTVAAVEQGSAAARAGVRPGDQLVAISGQALPPASARATRARQERIEAAMLRDDLEIIVQRGEHAIPVHIAREPGCASEFLIGRGRGLRAASSDGARVVVSAEIVDFAASDDELALALAHELAHNILGHNKGFAAQRVAGDDRSGAKSRDRELEADRWALYLMARAGYDIGVAPGFWRRWGPRTSFGIFSDGTHPGWRERAARAETEIARIKARQAAGRAPVP